MPYEFPAIENAKGMMIKKVCHYCKKPYSVDKEFCSLCMTKDFDIEWDIEIVVNLGSCRIQITDYQGIIGLSPMDVYRIYTRESSILDKIREFLIGRVFRVFTDRGKAERIMLHNDKSENFVVWYTRTKAAAIESLIIPKEIKIMEPICFRMSCIEELISKTPVY